MKITAIIPARYGSKRLPGKAIAEIAGRPMIRWVWEAASAAKGIDEVIIATDDKKIERTANEFGAKTVMTDRKIPTGTDRAASVIRGIYPSDRPNIVLNIQADEPMLSAAILDSLIEDFIDSNAPVGTAIAPARPEELEDPNVVKVVVDRDRNALYFSRSGIPFDREPERAKRDAVEYYRHVGVYIFRTGALLDFAQLEPATLEGIERLEQLRALEHGWRIQCTIIPEAAGLIGIDTAGDLKRVAGALEETSE